MLNKLFTPGPVGVAESVLKTMSKPVLFHRTAPFEAVYKNVSKKLDFVFDANENYITLILTGSGTMANEAVVNSLIKEDEKMLILSNGQFGERLTTITQIYKRKIKVLDFGWGNYIDLDKVKKEIRSYKPKWIFSTLLETSTGMVNPIHEIGELCHKSKVRFFVDAVSGLGAERLSVIKDFITVCTSVPNKAIEAPPGLSFVCVQKNIIEEIKDETPKSFYLDLARYYVSYVKNQTPTTPAVPLFVALDKALDNLLKEGLSKRQDRYKKLSSIVRKACRDLNIQTLTTDKKYLANAVTTLILPSHEFAEKLQKHLERKGLTVWHHNYGREDIKFNSMLQVAIMGDLKETDIKTLFSYIKEFLKHNAK